MRRMRSAPTKAPCSLGVLLVTLPWPDGMMSIVPAATVRSCSVSTAHMGSGRWPHHPHEFVGRYIGDRLAFIVLDACIDEQQVEPARRLLGAERANNSLTDESFLLVLIRARGAWPSLLTNCQTPLEHSVHQ